MDWFLGVWVSKSWFSSVHRTQFWLSHSVTSDQSGPSLAFQTLFSKCTQILESICYWRLKFLLSIFEAFRKKGSVSRNSLQFSISWSPKSSNCESPRLTWKQTRRIPSYRILRGITREITFSTTFSPFSNKLPIFCHSLDQS